MRFLLLLLAALPASAGEHPFFEPFPGSVLQKNEVKQLDEYEVPTGQLNSGRYVQSTDIEGKLTILHYDDPPQRSTLELMRTYEAAFKQQGFTQVYACKGRQCGSGCISDKAFGHYCVDDDHRFISAKRANGDHVALLLTGRLTRLAIVESAGGAAQAAPAVTSTPETVPAPKSSGRAPDEVETGIVKGLNSFGLHAKAGGAGSAADIIVEGKVTTAPLEASGDKRWKWARTNVTVSIKDGRNGATIARFDATDRQASSDYNEAARRSHVELGKKVSEQVKEAVTNYFENQ